MVGLSPKDQMPITSLIAGAGSGAVGGPYLLPLQTTLQKLIYLVISHLRQPSLPHKGANASMSRINLSRHYLNDVLTG